jgi:hypothetical protein
MCYFSTTKFVTVHDYRLGCVHNILILAILSYVILYQILMLGSHLKTENPIGSVAFQLKRPTEMSELKWWDASDIIRINAVSKFPPTSDLKYCNDSTLLPIPTKKLPCRYFNEDDIAPTRSMGGPFLNLATRVTEIEQVRVCEAPINDTCRHVWKTGDYAQAYFVAGAEDFIMMIDHQAFTPSTGVNGSSTMYTTPRLYFSHDESYLTPQDGTGFYGLFNRDLLTVRTLLAAAGVNDLDEFSPGLLVDNSTHRYTGITLLLNIWYYNFEPWQFIPGTVKYDYRVFRGSTYQTYHAAFPLASMDVNASRLWQNRHGVNIQVQQEGKLSSFDAFVFTVFLASTIALQTLAVFIVDFVAMYLLSGKLSFKNAKYEKILLTATGGSVQRKGAAAPLLDDERFVQLSPSRTKTRTRSSQNTRDGSPIRGVADE